jgi:hypothetical protein
VLYVGKRALGWRETVDRDKTKRLAIAQQCEYQRPTFNLSINNTS